MSLEDLILRHVAGLDIPSFDRTAGASGVMMIPIPKGGTLKGFGGMDAATKVEHIAGINITAKLNYPIHPLPEGSSYLGFIFARGVYPQEVEAALREAHAHLEFDIRPVLSLNLAG